MFCFCCLFTAYLYSFGRQATEVVTEKAKEITKTVEEKVQQISIYCIRHVAPDKRRNPHYFFFISP